jgi:hypothetical protein
MELITMGLQCDFQPLQIVCLDHQHTCLYAEVIQVVESRQVCWVRPILLVEFPQGDRASAEPLSYDLRPTVDLLWSCALFRPALDTEILPFLTHLFAEPVQHEPNSLARAQLNQFIEQLWQAQKHQS